jgi:hypothetical protein
MRRRLSLSMPSPAIAVAFAAVLAAAWGGLALAATPSGLWGLITPSG